MITRILKIFNKPDFKKNPLKAFYRRIVWHTRWKLTQKPWIIKLSNNLTLRAPKGGAGASIYYQGSSEPEVARTIQKLLEPGMVFIDVGAHIGEYSLLASPLVGSLGSVHAFEPNPHVCKFLEMNIRTNKLKNVKLYQLAVSEKKGSTTFQVYDEPSIGSISKLNDPHTNKTKESIVVSTVRLDNILHDNKVDLIKVDVEGAELFVMRGAEALLRLPDEVAPVIVFEVEPANYACFDYTPEDLFVLLRSFGYEVYSIKDDGKIERFDGIYDETKIKNALASKSTTKLVRLI